MATAAIVGGTLAGSYISSQGAKSASKTAAKAQQASADLQYKMWSKSREDFQPFLEAGQWGIHDLRSGLTRISPEEQAVRTASQGVQDFQLTQAPEAGFTVNPITGEIIYGQAAGVTSDQLTAGGALSPALPELPGEVDFEFDPNDPIYKFKQEQLNEQVNRQLAARGLYDSRAGLDVLSEANMNLISSEADTQYARLRAERDYLAQRATDLYSMGAQRGQTLYDRLYGQQQDLYNRLYGQTTTEDTRQSALLQDKVQAAMNIYGLDYQQALDLAKIGAGAAGSAGQQTIAASQNIGSSLANVGAYQAQGQLAQSNIYGQTLSGLGTYFGNYLNQQQQPMTNAYTSPGYYSPYTG